MTRRPVSLLERSLDARDRLAISRTVRGLLAWQRALASWRPAARAPDATPFVSLYARGVLRGCFGSSEGSPPDRLVRAFLRALEDTRYGMVHADERSEFDVAVSYPRSLRVVSPARIADEVEPGRDGLIVLRGGSPAVLMLPAVARDAGVSALGLLDLLRRKAKLADWGGATLLAWTVGGSFAIRFGPRGR